MAERNENEDKNKGHKRKQARADKLHPDTKKSIWAIVFVGAAIILSLAAFAKAGPLGDLAYQGLKALFGAGYFILPLSLLFGAGALLFGEKERFVGITLLGVGLIVLSTLGLIELADAGEGGWLGFVLGSLKFPFGETAAIVINSFVLLIAVLIAANLPIKIRWPKKDKAAVPTITGTGSEESSIAQKAASVKNADDQENDDADDEIGDEAEEITMKARTPIISKVKKAAPVPKFENYVPPPLSLLKSANDKPTTGDLLANANVIKRTLDSFGIPVDMGEINIGPSVTRYTLKPAEGVKLSRITALNQDLALALAAHPIRIEAPIPGKSLVGIEVPNKAAALVRLGSLMGYPEFQKIGLIGFVLGRDVSGEPIFADIERMPHLLVAGATGSGKSILIHSLLISLLYKNSPATLKLILIDPKRVELSVYRGLPHLVSPVVVDNKKAVGVFRWAISEMDRRYEILLQAGSRDVKSYNASGKGDVLPYLLIVVDELADLMSTYGREVEGSIVRLAQMARATGIHLVLSTQRPSVEVITGLIKANITSRIALQVASGIDSRTILDTSGAEKLLGRGDLLYVTSDISKPKRIQSSYITEEEINKVTDFIRDNNKGIAEAVGEVSFENGGGKSPDSSESGDVFDDYLEDGDDDEVLDQAIAVIAEAKKASASLLQRRLKVGYARAARLLDIMESLDLIGPGDGAKPRDVNMEKIEERMS
ncbi:MAG: DNA translocase FtsK [Candidatus Liptonbacteria bacterium]|nr:DNA translocase FtsK [Candidatus Liptonbacteria bacterium]